MKFDYFVIPFLAGLIFMLGYLVIRYAAWYIRLSKNEKSKVARGFLSVRLFAALKEIVMESLLHRKIFMKNRLLGFMHMSLAFGWFLLILMGNLESRVYEPAALNPPYVPIFFRFFHANPGAFPFHTVFSFLMDLLLLFVLTGVLLAFVKRFRSSVYGMKRTTRLMPGDRFALTALWLIFPLRLFAESFTSSVYGGGDFLTGTLGSWLGDFLPAQMLYYPAWWAYSISLGVFFTALPFSRYMHIPTEIVLIFSRHFGLKEREKRSSLTEIEINSCSRCGICIDACQMSFAGGIHNTQSAYQLKAIRYNQIDPKDSFNCLLCRRCESVCPVGLDINNIRMIVRNELNGRMPDPSFVHQTVPQSRKADVVYFAGCMGHQTPAVKKAMLSVFAEAGVNYWFMDESGGLCCGRPMMLAGHREQAMIIVEKNRRLILESGASTLVTSCPICFKIFSREYDLPVNVLHHSQYLLSLIERKKITLRSSSTRVVYHDPCELSRDIRVYDEPRKVLSHISVMVNNEYEKDNTLCCGSSLANLSSDNEVRKAIAGDAYEKLTSNNAQVLVTSCPMCKKSFEKVSEIPVRDIAEQVNLSMLRNRHAVSQSKREKHRATVAG